MPWILFTVVGCGQPAATTDADAPPASVDAIDTTCQPQGAIGTFYRRTPNPRLIAGNKQFLDGKLDTAIADPDLRWDETSQRWHLYYQSPHGTFAAPGTTVIRHATSATLATWTFDDVPALALDGAAAPSVTYNPDQHGYLMLYAMAGGLGAATSSDGALFTSVGLVLSASNVYPNGGTLGDPEVVYARGLYHLWLSSAGPQIFGIAHATSMDGMHWTVEAAPVTSLLRASADKTTGGAKPSAIYDELHCRWEMWLTNDVAGDSASQPVLLDNSSGVWHATSTNATSWSMSYTQARDVSWDGSASGEHLGMRGGADVAAKSTGRYMVYVGFDDANVPTGSLLPSRAGGTRSGVMTLDVAARDAP